MDKQVNFEKLKNMTEAIKSRINSLQNDLKTLQQEFKPFIPVATDIYKQIHVKNDSFLPTKG